MSKIDNTINDVRKMAEQNASASKHWDKAVRYARIIKKFKTQRDDAQKTVLRLRAALMRISKWDFPAEWCRDDIMGFANRCVFNIEEEYIAKRKAESLFKGEKDPKDYSDE